MRERTTVSTNAQSITVHVPMTFRKRGGRKLVVTPDGAAWAPRPRVDNAMVKALARAFRWRQMLDGSVHATLGDLARAKGVGASYVSRVLRLTMLAPEIVEAILDGRQPAELQLNYMLTGFPLDSEGQLRWATNGTRGIMLPTRQDALPSTADVRNSGATMDYAREEHPALVTELDTPVVTIDLDRVDRNIARTQERIAFSGRANRPHIKTHKIPEIARMQMQAGAIGITCQKLDEAAVFIDAGICDDILITFNIVGERKTEQLMELTSRIGRLAVVADNETVLRGLSAAARRSGRDLPVLIECDTGFGRNGVQTPEAALDFARRATQLPNLLFEGLMVFPNTAPRTLEFFTRAIELFATAGIPLPVLSGGGTPALNALADYPMMTEHRAGTYVYNDVMMVHSKVATWDDCALHVRSTVVSRPTSDRAIVDAGSKVLTREQYYVQNFGRVVEYPDAVVVNVSEEHGIIDLSACRSKPEVGDVIRIIPNHCCVVSNMVDEVYAAREGRVASVLPVAARGGVR